MNKKSNQIKSRIYHKDSRQLAEIFKDEIVDVTITSPPYYDLKDYGYTEQIGFGQEYSEYLNDLKTVFKNVFECTKKTGTLWVIIDSFRQNNEVIPLPFDFSAKMKEVGWKLQDIIIWEKDRTVPWAHRGQMRNLFEYILIFSKSAKYIFDIDSVRDFEILKKWWIRYPERYNPKGKTPSGLWKFDIPTQGSWGNGYIRHFCPLPEELIGQILKLTTKENDIVLDPFAGSGAVLAKAESMNRKYIGFELNKKYIDMFTKYLKKTSKSKTQEYNNSNKLSLPQKKFENLILDLRALKFGKLIYSKFSDQNKNKILKIFVSRTTKNPSKKNALVVVDYLFYISSNANLNSFQKELNAQIQIPPLSKFGVEANFRFTFSLTKFLEELSSSKLYTYTDKITHKYKTCIKRNDLGKTHKTEIIISPINVNISENSLY